MEEGRERLLQSLLQRDKPRKGIRLRSHLPAAAGSGPECPLLPGGRCSSRGPGSKRQEVFRGLWASLRPQISCCQVMRETCSYSLCLVVRHTEGSCLPPITTPCHHQVPQSWPTQPPELPFAAAPWSTDTESPRHLPLPGSGHARGGPGHPSYAAQPGAHSLEP